VNSVTDQILERGRRLKDDLDMRVKALAGLVGSLLAFIAVGCDGSGTCGNSAACGGNVVGTWKITSSCVSVNASASTMNSQCPGETVSSSNVRVSGSVTYNADGTYTSTGTTSGFITVNIPQSCLTINGVTVTCAQITQASQANPTAGVTLNCSGTSGCTCTESIADQTSDETGTYTTTAAGVLTQTPTSGTASSDDYCVKGTTMTLSPHADSTMMTQIASGTITLTKN
jgi:hypothetical protein